MNYDSAPSDESSMMNSRLTIRYLPFCLLFLAGCSQPQTNVRTPATPTPAGTDDRRQRAEDSAVVRPPSSVLGLPAGFAPVKIGILPLTELSGASGTGQRTKVSAFVTMVDAFGSQVKAPGVLRLELYEHVPRSAQTKGPRLAIWPDIDLTSPAENHKYWREFLRAYEFEMDAQIARDKTYVLEVTCLGPDGKRLSAEYTLRGTP